MQYKKIDISLLEQNNGQLEGLPLNPRTWNRDELDILKRSLKQIPELFEARGIIVYPYKDKYIVLGGNMRLAASKSLKLKQVPCIVVDERTPLDKLKEIVIKDNGSFGAWDVDALKNDWADLPLEEWGCDVKFNEDNNATQSNVNNDIIYQIAIDCANEQEQETIYNELKDKYECHILTL